MAVKPRISGERLWYCSWSSQVKMPNRDGFIGDPRSERFRAQ